MEKESTSMNSELIRIVTIGPESTGKSSLCESLAKTYKTLWCPEYAREFLLRSKALGHIGAPDSPHGNYDFEDLLSIAKGQIALENEMAEKAIEYWSKQSNKKTTQPVLFVDTDMYVMKVWSEYVFGKCHPFILEQIAERPYDFYLLCGTDLPWVKDELREYPDPAKRNELYHIYHDLLVQQHVPWSNVVGDQEARVGSAMEAIEKQFPELFR